MKIRFPLMSAAADLGGEGGGGGGAGAAGGAAGAAGSAGAAGGAGSGEHWTSGFQDADLRGWAQNRGWDGPEKALAAHRDLEKLRGVPASRLLTIPENAEDAEAWKGVYSRLGAPETPDGYQLPAMNVREGGIDLTGDFRQWAHAAGLNQSQAAGIMKAFNERAAAIFEASTSQTAAQAEADTAALRQEWGKEFEANMVSAKRAYGLIAEKIGLEEKDIAALEDKLGTGKTYKLFALIGNGSREFGADAAGGPSGVTTATPFGMTPDAARTEVKRLEGDAEFMRKAMTNRTGPEAERRRALYKIVTGGS